MRCTNCPRWRTLASCVSATGAWPSSLKHGPWHRASSLRHPSVGMRVGMQARLLRSTNIQADEASERWHMSQVQAVTRALQRMTLSDPDGKSERTPHSA